ncbi:hypothetical protein [Actinomadura coerulea]|uniref:hypothetical protein n=1 Tax=Actinomadura coerulea TaxID=46159 RepID=UPI0034323B89
MSVTLLLLQYLFPGWSITVDRAGIWRASGRVLISSSSVEGLFDLLRVADPAAVEQAAQLLTEPPEKG